MWIGCPYCLWGAARQSGELSSTQHLYKQRPLPVHKEPQSVEGGISSREGNA